jgi:predicted nucleic acid-binding protein
VTNDLRSGVSELVIDARVLAYRVAVGVSDIAESQPLDERLLHATTLVAPSCEFLRAHRILRSLGSAGKLSPSEVVRLSMLVCESGVELRPLWPWDIPRVASLTCHPSDAWCVALAESLGVPFVTLNPRLRDIGATCPVEVF